MKIKRILAVFIIISIFFLTACGNNKGENAKEEIEQSLSEEVISLCMIQPDTLNPLLTLQSSNADVYDLIYDSLVYVDKELRPVSALAERCSVSEDGKTIDFTLKEGITWHDGKAFTSFDVEHTFKQIMGAEKGLYKDRLANVTDISVTDTLHFKMYLAEPNVSILNLLDFPIVPLHISDLEKNPIGTGMYKFVEIDNKKMKLQRNENWLLGDKPKFKKVNVTIVDSEEDTFSLLKLGEASVAAAEISKMGTFGAGNNIVIESYPTLQYEFLGMNFENDALSSYGVRQAISYAVNRDKITDDVYYGYADAANAPVPSTSWLYDPDYNRFSYDAEKAKALLLSDGYVESDGVCVKETEDGSSLWLEFSILVNEDNSYRMKSAESICKSLAEIGIKAYVTAVPFEEYLEKIEAGEYSLFMGGYNLSADMDFRFMLSSDAIENGTNIFKYSSIDMDNATKALCTPTTDEGIKEAYSYFQMVFSRDVPFAGIAFINGVIARNNRIETGGNTASYKIYRDLNLWSLKN